MGQGQSLKNLDKRTARREYNNDFSHAIRDFRCRVEDSRHLPFLQPSASVGEGNVMVGGGPDKIQVNVRKRPLFDKERSNSEFDVISCITPETVVVHDARLDCDMKTQLLRHHEFTFQRVFGENATNDDVYREVVEPMVRQVSRGNNGTVFMYGQSKRIHGVITH